jgi:hypothetical protein
MHRLIAMRRRIDRETLHSVRLTSHEVQQPKPGAGGMNRLARYELLRSGSNFVNRNYSEFLKSHPRLVVTGI